MLLAKYVLQQSLWFPSISQDPNAMLSIVMLAPIYSVISNLSLAWCFKIIYPLLFSLVPVGLLVVYSKLTNHNIAFLACILFISVSSYFTTLPAAARQEIAELFLTLILISLIDEKIGGYNKSILLVLFGFSMVVSHYGVSYIFLFIIVISLVIVLLLKRLRLKTFKEGFEKFRVINNVYPIFILCFALAWFIYVASSSIFHDAGNLGVGIFNSITDLFNPDTSQGARIIQGTMPIFLSIERYLYLLIEALIGIGILSLFFYNTKINQEFKAFSMAMFLILIIGVVFPYFASAMNTDRLFHISLFFLSIYFVIGALIVFKVFNIILTKFHLRLFKINAKKSLYLIGIFLLIFSLFNTAFLYQIFDQPKLGRFALDNNVDFYELNNQEISGVYWMKNNNNPGTIIYADVFRAILITSLNYPYNLAWSDVNQAPYRTIELTEPILYSRTIVNDSYIFLGTFNIKNNSAYVLGNSTTKYNQLVYVPVTNFAFNYFRIYDNGHAEILKGTG